MALCFFSPIWVPPMRNAGREKRLGRLGAAVGMTVCGVETPHNLPRLYGGVAKR